MGMSLRDYWHPICTIDEVGERPCRFVLLGEELVAFRSPGGISVFKDLCIHRGAALSGGKVENGNLVCPYHGWTYDPAGACVHIPSLSEGARIPIKARAIAYHARDAFGLVWVCLGDGSVPFPEWPDEAWSRVDHRVVFVKAYDWKTSAGRVVENAMDFSHFNFVHAGYTELADGPVIKPHEVTRTERGLRYAYDDGHLLRDYVIEFPFIVHDRKSVVNASAGSTWSDAGDSKAGDVTTLSFLASPVSDGETRTFVFVGRNHSLDRDDREFTGGFDAIMEQDRVVVESQRPEQIPLETREEIHLRFPDAAAVQYRRMLRELDSAEAFAA